MATPIDANYVRGPSNLLRTDALGNSEQIAEPRERLKNISQSKDVR